MSHHFSPEFTVLPAGKEPVSKKLQRNNEKSSSARRKETEQLDLDNKQLEWKLNQLRQVMSKEKEDRGKQGSIWKSGNARIESHSRNILGRTVSATTTLDGRQKVSPKPLSKSASKSKSPSKVKVLKDEPLDLPQRDSLTKDLMRRINSDAPISGEPRKNTGPKKRLEHWIQFSMERNSSEVYDLQSNLEGNLELSTVQAMSPAAIGVYFMKWGRKRLLIAAEGVIRKPKTGWGDEIYYPYTVKPQSEVPIRPEPPLRNLSNKHAIPSPRPPKSDENGGSLLEGDFDEAKNAAAFQQALMEWRNGKSEENISPDNFSSKHGDKSPPQMAVHVAQCTPEPFEVKFSETSTLSYMEQVLLQKHRRSDAPSFPRSLTDAVNDHLDENSSGRPEEIDNIYTAEEEEERERYRQIFSTGTFDSEPKFTMEEVNFGEIEEDIDTTNNCFVEESPPVTPPPSSRTSSSTVKIEEVFYIMDDSNSILLSNDAQEELPSSANERSSLSSLVTITPRQSSDEEEFKENCDPSHKKSEKSARKSEPKHTRSHSAKTGTVSLENHVRDSTLDKNRSKTSLDVSETNRTSGISYEPSPLVSEIGTIPMNPDAFYNKGFDAFFDENDQTEAESFQSQFHNFEGEDTVMKISESWNPVTSIPGESTYIDSIDCDHHDTTSFPAAEHVPFMNMNPANRDSSKHLSAKDSERYDNTSDSSDESADERTLDDLEWELASQMGNITADGRISRLIDDWPEEGDLEIIDDPGSGSGLTTPDVNSNRASRISTRDQNDSQMQYDFHNMEHIVMDDLSDEYNEDEV